MSSPLFQVPRSNYGISASGSSLESTSKSCSKHFLCIPALCVKGFELWYQQTILANARTQDPAFQPILYRATSSHLPPLTPYIQTMHPPNQTKPPITLLPAIAAQPSLLPAALIAPTAAPSKLQSSNPHKPSLFSDASSGTATQCSLYRACARPAQLPGGQY